MQYKSLENFSRYRVYEDGTVFDLIKQEFIRFSKNPAGYYSYRFVSDTGIKFSIFRHRLLCMVFKPVPNMHNLYVNHINGIKGDDRLDNLEWVTAQENAIHAGKLELTQKCKPVIVRNFYTKETTYYNSFLECALDLNLSKDQISYRVKHPIRVFPEGYQFKLASDHTNWDNNPICNVYGTKQEVLVRNVLTNEIIKFDFLSDAAKFLGVSLSTASTWLSMVGQPIVGGKYQLKRSSDTSDWRQVTDIYLDQMEYYHKSFPVVIDTNTGNVTIYDSCNDCAKDNNVQQTTLTWRLKSKGTKVYSDGKKYCYYEDYIQLGPNNQ